MWTPVVYATTTRPLLARKINWFTVEDKGRVNHPRIRVFVESGFAESSPVSGLRRGFA